MKHRIYVPQLDQIFDSIAEAAGALDVNAANISKVLRGSRKTAGGDNFISAVTAEGKRRTRASLRKAARELLPDPLAEERAELKHLIQAVNKQIQRVRGSGWGAFAGAIEDLAALGDVFGRTKAGYLKASDTLLYQLNEAEIHKYMEAIEERRKRKTYTISGAMKEAERLAGTFWTTSSRVAELGDILPFIFAMMHNEIPDMGGSEIIRRTAAAIFNTPTFDPDNPEVTYEQALAIDRSRMLDDIVGLSEYVDTTAALEEMLKNDFFLLDKFAAIRPELELLLQAYHTDGLASSQILADQLEETSKFIIENWTRPQSEIDYMLDLAKDDIHETMRQLDIYLGDQDEE